MKCPVCNAELPSTAKFCGGCGTTLTAPPPPPSPPAAASFEKSYPVVNAGPGYGGAAGFSGGATPVVKKKYKVLRLIAVLMKILAVLVGAIMIIGGLVMIVAGAAASSQTTPSFDTGPTAFLGGAVAGLILIVYGVLVFAFLYAYAEWMYVFMDIEENTRMTNEMLSGRK